MGWPMTEQGRGGNFSSAKGQIVVEALFLSQLLYYGSSHRQGINVQRNVIYRHLKFEFHIISMCH